MPQVRKHPSHAERQAAYRKRQTEARQQELEKKGLPHLPAVSTMPGTSRWDAALSAARLLVEQVTEEMEEYFQDRSEGWKESDRGEQFIERLEATQEVLEELMNLSPG